MSVWRLLVREIFYHKLNFVLGLLAVLVTASCVIGSQLLVKQHDLNDSKVIAQRKQQDDQILKEKAEQTEKLLKEKEKETADIMKRLQQDIKKTTVGLGFTLTIMHKDVDLFQFQADQTTDKYIPDTYPEKLANSGILSINHLLPILQERVQWKALDGRTITVIGTMGEVRFKDRKPKPEMQKRVPEGTIVLGHELFAALNRGRRFPLLVGKDTVEMQGKKLKIHQVQPRQGNRNDSNAFINLKEAQEMFDKKGLISGVFAVGCNCEADRLATIRKEVQALLPNTQVIEDVRKERSRSESRLKTAEKAKEALESEKKQKKQVLETERERKNQLLSNQIARTQQLSETRRRTAWIVIALVLAGCALVLAVIIFLNVRQRRNEIGILRAIGLSSQDLFILFLCKTLILTVLGAIAGTALGWVLIAQFAPGTNADSFATLFEPWRFVLTIAGVLLLCSLTALVPSLLAARQDPALVLSEE